MNIFNHIKNNIDLKEVCQTYKIDLVPTQSGIYFKGKCPFDGCNKKSFTISPIKGIFYCFDCHENGDAVNMIEKLEFKSGIEAAQKALYWYRVAIPEELEEDCIRYFGADWVKFHKENPNDWMITEALIHGAKSKEEEVKVNG